MEDGELYESDEFKNLSKKEINEIKKVEKQISDSEKIKTPRIRHSTKKVNKDEIYDRLNAIISEFIDCFILIGFDTNGDEMVMMNIQNALEERGLRGLVRDVVLQSGVLGDGLMLDGPPEEE